ncbi:MAG: hypothetical protein KBF99_19460 [Leptospiraceae bacterium]|nr:hypothetical protein [Leptospiraceae bacterium]
MNNEIEISPLYTKLVLEIEAIRKEYSILWEEKDRLENQLKPLLLIKFNLELGHTILAYMNMHLYFLKLKRKIELLQMHINQNRQVNMNEIESSLYAEFQEWISQISKLEKDIRVARQTTFDFLKPEDSIRLQEIYRKLVRILHPDLNKNITENQKILWNRVQDAYKNLDLEGLLNLEILAGSEELISEISSLEVLTKKKDKLWNQFQILTKSVDEVKKSFPLDLERELDDPEWIKRESGLYQNKTKEIESLLPQYEKIYKDILFQLYGLMQEHPENL